MNRLDVSARPVLEFVDVSTRFRTARGVVHAVDHVSLTVRAGETIGLVGESGSGKSVLARTAVRLLPPSAIVEGEVRYRGQDVLGMTAESSRRLWGKEIALIFQDSLGSLNPTQRIGTPIVESLRMHLGMSRAEAKARAVELLAEVGITNPNERVRNYPHEFSGGMRQRAAIALAIACSPQVVFADEPTTALDVTIQCQILDLLAALSDRNQMSLILTSHDLGVVANRADRVVVMYGGRVVESGSVLDVFDRTQHPYTAALMRSIPRVDDPVHHRLEVIPGSPADVIDPKPGCRFAPRCQFAQAICREEDPPLHSTGPDHAYACFFPLLARQEARPTTPVTEIGDVRSLPALGSPVRSTS